MHKEGISEQVLQRKKGRIVSSLVDKLGDTLSITSWSVERLPEYLWLALILEYEGREKGIARCKTIIQRILSCDANCSSVQMSYILTADEKLQDKLFTIIKSEVPHTVMVPLTAIAGYDSYPLFYKHFCDPEYDFETRIGIIGEVLRKYNDPDCECAIDLKYLALLPKAFSGHLKFQHNSPFADAVLHYGDASNDGISKKIYQSSIKSLELCVVANDGVQSEWVKHFWNVSAKATECKLCRVIFEKEASSVDYRLFIEKTKEAVNFLNIQHKDEMISDKYSVLIGSLTYALKTFSEVIEHDLGNTIIGRQSVRSIIEVYIMMKYLALKEGENPQVWNHYKAYGVGKYKLVLLKIREGMGNGISHVSDKMLDLLVNEPQTEELTEVDLRYFDNEKIRDKAIAVGEKELYDIAYDYDSSFAHALWGAVRESSMLACDNIFHHFSPVPDATFSQNLSDVTADCFSISKKLIEFANAYFAFPEWYVSYLGELHV